MVVLTFWLMALLPSLSRALVDDGGAATARLLGQLCSAADAGRVPPHLLLEHCPLCSPQAQQDLAPPPPAALPALRMDLGHRLPERFLSASAPLHAWDQARARAPPAGR